MKKLLLLVIFIFQLFILSSSIFAQDYKKGELPTIIHKNNEIIIFNEVNPKWANSDYRSEFYRKSTLIQHGESNLHCKSYNKMAFAISGSKGGSSWDVEYDKLPIPASGIQKTRFLCAKNAKEALKIFISKKDNPDQNFNSFIFNPSQLRKSQYSFENLFVIKICAKLDPRKCRDPIGNKFESLFSDRGKYLLFVYGKNDYRYKAYIGLEEKRLADAKKKEEEAQKAKEAEQKRIAAEKKKEEEEKRKAAEKKKEEEEKRIAAAKKKEEEAKKAQEDEELFIIGSGTGFFVNGEGYIATNEHVAGICQMMASLINGEPYQFKILVTDKLNDLALLKGDYKNKNYLNINSLGADFGEDIVTFGYPLSDQLSSSVKLTRGIVSSLSGPGNNISQIQIDAAIQPGNSGGPILNYSGQVIGVASSGLNKLTMLANEDAPYIPENVNFAVAAPTLSSFLKANQVKIYNETIIITNTKELAKVGMPSTIQLFCLNTKTAHQNYKNNEQYNDVLLKKVIEFK